jgi:hypothetical protein
MIAADMECRSSGFGLNLDLALSGHIAFVGFDVDLLWGLKGMQIQNAVVSLRLDEVSQHAG